MTKTAQLSWLPDPYKFRYGPIIVTLIEIVGGHSYRACWYEARLSGEGREEADAIRALASVIVERIVLLQERYKKRPLVGEALETWKTLEANVVPIERSSWRDIKGALS